MYNIYEYFQSIWKNTLKKSPLHKNDPVLFDIIMNEHKRENECIELIASENYTSLAVRECLGSVLTNKYSEGQPGKRYYGGNKYIDMYNNKKYYI